MDTCDFYVVAAEQKCASCFTVRTVGLHSFQQLSHLPAGFYTGPAGKLVESGICSLSPSLTSAL